MTFCCIVTNKTSAQEKGKVLTVRTLEVVDDSYQGKIVIMEEDGKTSEIKLQRFKPGVFVDNSKRIHEALNSVIERGYKIIGTSGGAGAVFLVTNYIFQKDESKK